MIEFDTEKTKEQMDMDQFKFSVGMKYDLSSKDLTFKKIKYISPEI